MSRDEIARAAGVSFNYYTRIEQGRVVPTTAVLDAIAKALALGDVEYEYLLHLAYPRRAGQKSVAQPARSTVHLLDSLDAHPAFLLTRFYDVLVANTAARSLFSPETVPGNLFRWLLTSPSATRVVANRSALIPRLVADARYRRARWLDDPHGPQVLSGLHQESGEFRRAWGLHRVDRLDADLIALRDGRRLTRFQFRMMELEGESQRLLILYGNSGTTPRGATVPELLPEP
jgi:transcriptional regulator with XRE-family HTH domain